MFRKMVQKTPPGLLSICAIIDLTQTKTSSSKENQLEEELISSNLTWNKLKELNTHFIMRPTVLPQILVHLTEMLVEILGICSDSSSVARRFGLSKVPRYFRLVLQLERPFYDLFRILVELFCRTWNDMNAKFDEINKVYNVVQDQFERSLFENPNSLEQLEIEMLRKRFSYFNMQKIWKCEQREQEELELNSEDIQPLRDHLRPEIENLAIHRRIALLKKGMNFQRVLPLKTIKENQTILSLPSSVSVHSSPVHSSGLLNSPQQQQQYWFWCLDEKEKFFNVCDCHLNNGKHFEIISETNKKLFVSEIKNILNGQQLISHLNQQQHGAGKLYKKSQNILRCGIFIEFNNSSEFLLCAQNEQDSADWFEALNCLCWPQKSLQNNINIKKEVDQLLNLQINIRLMDVPKLEEKLKIPELPTNFNWIST
uniref:Uncharacterized protein n=1 Tax=Meloidogyne enterolobii TaxID=390850 RepID=A0A6V7UEL2_MELEN|nr:unnamed protein product [Meloidogyne enterolobii]